MKIPDKQNVQLTEISAESSGQGMDTIENQASNESLFGSRMNSLSTRDANASKGIPMLKLAKGVQIWGWLDRKAPGLYT